MRLSKLGVLGLSIALMLSMGAVTARAQTPEGTEEACPPLTAAATAEATADAAATEAATEAATVEASPEATEPVIESMETVEATTGAGYLGIQAQDSADGCGAEVTLVEAGGPAETAGLQVGDVIIGANGEETRGLDALRELVIASAPGTELELVVVRGEETLNITVTLGERPAELDATEAPAEASPEATTEAAAEATLEATP